MMRLFFNSTMRAPLSAEPFYTYIILSRLIFVKRFFAGFPGGYEPMPGLF